MAQPVLITGFGTFGAYNPNPAFASLEIAKSRGHLPKNVEIGEIPTVWDESSRAFRQLIDLYEPRRVLSLGVLGVKLSPHLTIENRGVNTRTTTHPDARLNLATSDKIDPQGPDEALPNLDCSGFAQLFTGSRIVVKHSSDAGNFLCNDLLYSGSRMAAELGFMFGFMHVPLVREISDERKAQIVEILRQSRNDSTINMEGLFEEFKTLSLDELVEAIANIARAISD